MSYLERAITDGHAKLTGEGKQQPVPAPNGGARVPRVAPAIGKFGGVDQLHVAVNHIERYADPEEQVRAEFWAELDLPKHQYGRADLLVSQMAARQRRPTVLEREANIIANLPRQYGKPEAGQKRTKAKGQTLNAKMNSTRTVSAFSLQPSAFPAQVQPRQQGGAHRRDQEMPSDPLGGRQALDAGGFMNFTS